MRWDFIPLILVVGGFLSTAARASQESAPAVRIVARIVSAREAEITAQYLLPGPYRVASTMNHLAMRIPGQSLEIVSATARGRTLPVISTLQDGVLHLNVELPDFEASEYEIRYHLRSNHNARLPLLVPVAETGSSGATAGCEITVFLPDDWESVGCEFPWFEPQKGRLRATLPNLPALLVIQGGSRGEVDLFDRWFTLDHLTNTGLLLLLIAASAYRILLMRRGDGRAGAWRSRRPCDSSSRKSCSQP